MPRPMSSPYRTMEITLPNLAAFFEDLKQDSDAVKIVEQMQWAVHDPDVRIYAAYYDNRPVAVIGILQDVYLRFIVVREPHRRKGVGRSLVEKYAQHVKGITVDKSDTGCQMFFRKVGWVDYEAMQLDQLAMIRGDFLA